MSNATDPALERILFEIDEMDWLRTMTNRELCEEYLASESDVAIEEMLCRLWPGWADRNEVGH